MTKQDEPKKKRSSSWICNRNKEKIEVDEKVNTPKEDDIPSVSYYKLFQYSTRLDKLLILLAVIFGLLSGISIPMFYLLFGRSAGFLVDYCYTLGSNGTNPKIIEEAGRTLHDNMIWIVELACSLGVVLLVSTYLTTFLLNYTALRQTFKIRELFFAKVLNQDISWYDQNKTGSFSSRMVDDLKKIEEGLGEKFGMIIYYETIYVASLIQGLVNGWEFALICMISVPVAMILMGIVSWISSKFAKHEMEAYADAGSVAEEVLSSIKTVVAFGGQAKEEARYNRFLESAKNNNIKRALFNGISVGINWFFTYCSFSLSFWYGVNLVIRESNYPPDEQVYDVTNMITVFASVFCAQWHLGLASPYIETFGMAKGAAAKIFSIISSQPIINQSKGNGLKLNGVQGRISFQDVDFCYPSRKEIQVLRGFNLTINPGETVALVGNSGCGKSTCMQLIQRFYDVDSGYISIDDHKITDLDLDCLRSYIGVVGQEPVLFETTIAENIRYGFLKATQEEVEAAAKKANIHTFISALPLGYSTIIGERGAQLSGGQKQRIAIARALVRNPAILLLDEATSALDTNSESIVQAALDKASHGCTTVIVAHRLSTVRRADRIFVMSQGQVQEEGSHDDLMKSKGEYYRLVMAQTINREENEVIQQTDLNREILEKPEIIEEPEKINKFHAQNDVNADTIKIITTSSPLWSIMKFNSPELWLIIIGCCCCIITGAGIPSYSLFLGKVIGILSGQDMEEIRSEMDIYSICFIVIAVVITIATIVQFYSLGIAGENLTLRLRSLMFKAMLHQEVGWFDDKSNGVGSLCARLSGEPESVQGVTGQRIATLLNAGSTVITAVTISFCYEWKISLVALCFAPVIVISSFMEQKILANESYDYYRALENSSKIAVEAISSIRTVESLGCECIFHDLYMKELEPYVNTAKRNTHFRGVIYGIARSLQCFAYAAGLYYGSTLVIYQGLDIDSVFIVCESLLAGSMILANALAFAPNFSKGLIGADRILQLIHRTPKILNGFQDPEKLISDDAGNLNYRNVSFSYPNRPSVEVLTDLNLSVLKGKTVALVGSSGCGKSTIVQLLERFYDPTAGEITADDIGIQELKLPNLRFKFGMVSQEPNLFSKTIGENIAYGDNNRTVTMEEIISAAKQANIHNFIASLPLGYQTELGERGTQLSGGQKQRVAIARALVRNPKVLLLDEATSALDAESEAIVQEALDNAKVGRTCIIIAHRLTTIQTADVICVMNHGRIAEMGTHGELLSRKSLYYKLLSEQSSE